jgi:hypothetical protein
MTVEMLFYVLYILAAVGIVLRIVADRGYDLKPILYPDGKFQMNIVFTIVAGFFASIPTINLLAGQIVITDPMSILYGAFAVLVTAYGAPSILDGIGTIVTGTPNEKLAEAVTTTEVVTEEAPGEA